MSCKEQDKASPLTPQAVFKSGASRSEHAPAYHLIPPAAHKAWAVRMALGATTHGEFNWFKGINDRDFQVECLNHLEEHLRKFKAGDRSDDHLGAMMCSIGFLKEFQERGKLLLPTAYAVGEERGDAK